MWYYYIPTLHAVITSRYTQLCCWLQYSSYDIFTSLTLFCFIPASIYHQFWNKRAAYHTHWLTKRLSNGWLVKTPSTRKVAEPPPSRLMALTTPLDIKISAKSCKLTLKYQHAYNMCKLLYIVQHLQVTCTHMCILIWYNNKSANNSDIQ